MYNKQVVDYAELLLKHKQAQQDMLEKFKLDDSKIEHSKPEPKKQTPTISVIEDEQGVCYEISDGVIITRMSTDFFDTLVEHPKLNKFKVNG